MYWALGIAAGVVAYAWLSSEEQSALNSYHSSSRRLDREIKERKNQLNNYRKTNRAAREYYRHIELHHNSVLTGNNCYESYNEQKEILRLISGRIDALILQIIEFKKQLETANGSERSQLIEQLNTVRKYFNEAKQEHRTIKKQKDNLLNDLREINQKTRELKLYIRDNCGKKGHDWFQRHLERRSQSA